MTATETIHSDFETIERENQNYRISTYVKYRIASGDYQCKAILFESHNGRVLDASHDMRHKRTEIVSNEDDISSSLEACIESCKQTMNEIEDAKDVSVEVSIDG